MPSILLVRHGQASFGGENYDVLSDVGHEQAAALATSLKEREIRVDRVLSGGLARQRDTAAPIASMLGLECEVDPRWDEYSSEDVLTHHHETEFRESSAEGVTGITSRAFQDLLEGGLLGWIRAGDDSPADEPHPAFCSRVRGALGDLVGSLGSGETALVCTSGGALAALCVELLDCNPEAFVRFNRVTINAGVTKVVSGRSGTTLVTFNDHAHLERPGGRSLVTYR